MRFEKVLNFFGAVSSVMKQADDTPHGADGRDTDITHTREHSKYPIHVTPPLPSPAVVTPHQLTRHQENRPVTEASKHCYSTGLQPAGVLNRDMIY